MFGPIMRFAVGELQVELAPLRRDDMQLFVRGGGMQNHEVTKFLGRRNAPVLEDEYEWFDHTRTDGTTLLWGIYLREGKKRQLIGNTGLHHLGEGIMPYAVTGCMIFRPEHWGKGIAGAAHKARTWYAFTQMQPVIVQLRSAAYQPNTGSLKALGSVGYVPVFTERNDGFVDGQYLTKVSLDCVNPLEHQWNAWWHGDRVPERYKVARRRTLDALTWATEHVSFG